MPDISQAGAAASDPGSLTGKTVGRFVIRKPLGAGGMAQVYLAEDTTLQRVVAIKRMASGLQENDRDRKRLLKEAQRASALNHPNIASIYDVIEDHDELLLVMEYVEGTTLRAATNQRPDLAAFLNIAIQCADGLGAAHQKEIVHGDIKPENLMLTPAGRVKILDFGVARRPTFEADSDSPTASLATMTGSLSGTPAYMAPEVLTQKPYDGRADIFSLGLVFYEMLGGPQPFQTDSFIGTVARVLHDDIPSLSTITAKIPPGLDAIIQHMLAKDPAARYATAEDVAADLRAVQRGDQPSVATSAGGKTKPRIGTRSMLIAGAVILMLLAAIPLRHTIAKWLGAGASAGKSTFGISRAQTLQTLAVLPITTTDADPQLAALGNGLGETLTAKMTRLGIDHSLQVVSSSELRARHVTKMEEARQEFGATLGLQISLQRSADLVRVAYMLADAKTGRTLGGNTMDVPISDPFAMEDQVSGGVATALGMELRPEERRELASHGTGLPDAYNYFLQGRGYLEKGPESMDSAITLFTRALELDPNYGLAEAELGTAYWSKYESGKDKKFIPKARQACSKAVELGNAGASGHVCLGVLENGAGNYEKAVDEFTRAIQLDPSSDGAYTGMASAYERLGKLNDAEKTYQQVISLRPRYWKGYNQLGSFYFRQAQYDKCAAMFQKVAELTPDSFRGYANLGAVYLAEGKYAEAIQPLNDSLRIRATAATYSNLGTAYFHLRRFSEAARTYAEATRLNANDYLIWGNLGEAYYYAGDHAGAGNAYRNSIQLGEEALKVNPHAPDVLKDIANYHAMLGERAPALKSLNQALAYGKSDKEILFGAALVYNRLGETGTALEWLDKAAQAGYSLTTVRESPDLDNLRNNRRYQALVQGKQD
jgi:tetratricopeptide (TPR) repeat protein/tRNA A-37 threonylcarbamoyl transferase component Bud32/TolB-like protein